MEVINLEVKTRDPNSKAGQLNDNNIIPAEYYGHGVKNKSLEVNYSLFRKVYKIAGGNTIVELNIDGGEKLPVLIHDIQHDPVSGKITHVDFVNVKMTEEIHAKIPLRFTGVALAVKDLAGTFVANLNEVEVKCLPKDLVHDIEVSIEPLIDFNSYIRVKDLIVPAGITVLEDMENVVANVVPPRKEEEEVVAAVPAAEVPTEAQAMPEAEGEAGGDAAVASKEEISK